MNWIRAIQLMAASDQQRFILSLQAMVFSTLLNYKLDWEQAKPSI